MAEHSAAQPSPADQLAAFRPVLLPVAYNMTGSLEDAEDIVQDVLLKWLTLETGAVINAKAYLIRSTVNRCINFLRSARKMRVESYPGTWLPEPWYFGTAADAYRAVDLQNVLAYDILCRLETLNPLERAVFVMKEGFDYPHTAIAELIGKSPENTRQLLRRARAKISTASARAHKGPDTESDIVQRLTAAISEGDIESLIALFRRDIALYSDGGGKVAAIPQVLHGNEIVAKVLAGFAAKARFVPRLEFGTLNHLPAIMIYNGAVPDTILLIATSPEGVAGIYALRNPDKLRRFH